ncbi:hypothetical protein [Telluribacter humicola]|uniref:hypothetical protein n=1 Tax=Telluribacter humicola TaxID=1720261 RepID=UPI001A968F41|nr:hypothetical protein [Telluribacter humicola]
MPEQLLKLDISRLESGEIVVSLESADTTDKLLLSSDLDKWMAQSTIGVIEDQITSLKHVTRPRTLHFND